MKKSATILVFIIALISFHVCNAQTNNDLKLWYKKPAAVWEEALPIGNGRLGAMIFGAPAVDHVQFNEETLWAGEPHDYSNPGAFKYLGEIRDLIWQGRQKDAEDLALKEFMSVPIRQQKYQPFGDLWLSFPGHLKVEKYKRELDLSTAVCRTTYSIHDTAYIREYIASYPGNAIAINLSSDRKNALTFDIIFTSLHESTSVVATSDGYMTLIIKVKEGVLTGTAMLKVIIKGGKISAND
ncbi:MAG: glycoside hydrolase family 95 protein, partial [Bacteroidia bacterium]|nr:glycoside hydrolase family 95 protein [Bacteroidia bacterium]